MGVTNMLNSISSGRITSRRAIYIAAIFRRFLLVCRLWFLLTLDVLANFENGLALSQIIRRPPVHGEASLDVVNDERDANHQGNAQHHDGDQEPADAEQAVVHNSQQRRGARRRVHRLGQGHNRRGTRARQRTPQVLNLFESVAQLEQLAYRDADNRGNELADDGVSRLRKR